LIVTGKFAEVGAFVSVTSLLDEPQAVSSSALNTTATVFLNISSPL
jgi:hypothetical protein